MYVYMYVCMCMCAYTHLDALNDFLDRDLLDNLNDLLNNTLNGDLLDDLADLHTYMCEY